MYKFYLSGLDRGFSPWHLPELPNKLPRGFNNHHIYFKLPNLPRSSSSLINRLQLIIARERRPPIRRSQHRGEIMHLKIKPRERPHIS
ncbi:MAG: hypothetical protein U9R53_10930 [Chloroflexota bacterium]|nr:hypothetical protein [Chloroflexota bacterium]